MEEEEAKDRRNSEQYAMLEKQKHTEWVAKELKSMPRYVVDLFKRIRQIRNAFQELRDRVRSEAQQKVSNRKAQENKIYEHIEKVQSESDRVQGAIEEFEQIPRLKGKVDYYTKEYNTV